MAAKVNIVSESKLNGGDAIARSKENLVYHKNKPALVLLDFDQKAMPDEVRERLAEEFWATLITVLPGLSDAAHLIRQSTSTGLYRTDTGERFADLGWCACLCCGEGWR